jgi:hypothetical protein
MPSGSATQYHLRCARNEKPLTTAGKHETNQTQTSIHKDSGEQGCLVLN